MLLHRFQNDVEDDGGLSMERCKMWQGWAH